MEKNQKPSEFEMDKNSLKKLAALLRELRGTKSYDEVAGDTGIVKTNIQKLETEMVKKPNIYILKALAEYYGINPFKFYNFMGLYKEREAEEYFKEIFVEEGFLKIPLYKNYIDLCDNINKIASREVKKNVVEQALKKYNFSEKSDTFMGIVEEAENKFKVFIPLDEYKNIDPLNFVEDHNLNKETTLLITEIRKIESGEEELKKNEKLIYDGFVLEVTENIILGNINPEEKERLYLSTENQWKILNSMKPVEAVKICEIDLGSLSTRGVKK